MKCLNVALIGRPSSGKSTFLNTILGRELSIVAATPQTTRKAIRGIYTEERGQIVFIDTPGVSNFDKRAKEISKTSLRTLNNAEAVLFIVDAFDDEKTEAERLVYILKDVTKPLFVLINKCDSVKKDKIEKRRNYLEKSLSNIKEIFEISALKDEGIDEVLIELFKIAEEREPGYTSDVWTDESLEDRITELIRGAAIKNLQKELPHIVSVSLEDLELKKDDTVWLRAFINVDRQSQKGIVIGKNGKVISEIKKCAIKSLKEVFPYSPKIDLDLTVRVRQSKNEGW